MVDRDDGCKVFVVGGGRQFGQVARRLLQPLLRLVAGAGPTAAECALTEKVTEPVAEALGVNAYAKQLIDGRDRKQLERLCRYVMRPPLSQERLEWRPNGRLELTLKDMWKDSTRALVLEPFQAGDGAANTPASRTLNLDLMVG